MPATAEKSSAASGLTTAEIAEGVAEALERDCCFPFVDWNDLGEVTVQAGGRTFRATFFDITDEDQ